MYEQQEKKQDVLPSAELPKTPSRVTRRATATDQPVWTQALGDQPPATLHSAPGLQAKLEVSQPGDPTEQEADRVAEQVMRMPSQATPATQENDALMRKEHSGESGAQSVPPKVGSALRSGGGQSLDAATRTFMEARFGHDFSQVRVHTDELASTTAELLGARAFAHKKGIWLASNESMSDKSLIAHELAHIVQQNDDVIALRQATFLERRAWLSFFDHYLPRKFLNNYMDDTGTPITLSKQEMIDCNPIVDLRRSPAFLGEVGKLRSAGGGKRTISVSGWGGALTNGTLGNFTIYYEGELTVTPAGNWTFNGVMSFYDYWDFDPKPFGGGSGRPWPAEVKVRVANTLLPGRPFEIRSVKVPVQQTDGDVRATWAGGAPSHVGDKAARTAVDIAGGEVAGGAGGTGGEVAGGEAGVQSAEDLNRK